MSEDLERRVAELEAVVERLMHPVAVAEFPPVSDEDAARFREEFDAALRDFGRRPHTIFPSSLTVLDPESVRQLLRESVTVVKPGEVIFLRCPEGWTPQQVREMHECVRWWLEANAPDIRAMVIPHLDMAVAEAPA